MKNINTLTKNQFQNNHYSSSLNNQLFILELMQVLKDSTHNNQQRKKIILKYKETNSFQLSTYDRSSLEKIECSQSNKQNKNIVQDKKNKLTLKIFASKELGSKQRQLDGNKKFKQQKIKQVNSVLKTTKNHKQNINDQRSNQSKFNGYFKPSVIYFALKSTQQNQKKSNKAVYQSFQLNKGPSKSIKSKKNYQLAAFITQFVHKLNFWSLPIPNQQLNELKNTKRFLYSEFVQILGSLSMIRHTSESEYKIEIEDQKEELQKVYLLWRIFKANTFTTQMPQINNLHYFLINFILLLATILNIHVDTIEELSQIFIEKINNRIEKQNDCERSNLDSQHIMEPSHIFFIKNKKLLTPQPKVIFQGAPFIDFGEQLKSQISKEFELFRINRLNTQNSSKTVKLESDIDNSGQSFDFGSLLSPKSQQLAQTKRMKILEEIRQNEGENLVLSQKSIGNELNVFLSYKSPKSCDNKLIRNLQEVDGQTKKPQLLLRQRQKKNKRHLNEGPKIKYCQLNVVLNMQKARKLRKQKELILERGWTNSGVLGVRQSKQQKLLAKKKRNSDQISLNNQQSSKKRNVMTIQQQNYFERRKNSLRGMRILAQKMLLNEKKDKQYHHDQQQGLTDYDNEEVFLNELNSQEQINTRVSRLNDEMIEISNSTITIKDNECCFDLQEEEERGFHYQQADFILGDAFQLENEFKSKQLMPSSKVQQQQFIKTQTQLYEKLLQQQTIQRFPFKSKTFNTQENQFLQEDSSSTSQIKIKTERSNKKQARVIKSYLKIPILYVDVNMDEGKKQRIIIYEEDNPADLAKQFGQKHKLGYQMVHKLQEMLKQQIGGILGRIDEEDDQYNDTKEQISNE